MTRAVLLALSLALAPSPSAADPVHDFSGTEACVAEGDRAAACLLLSAYACTATFPGGGDPAQAGVCFEMSRAAWEARLDRAVADAPARAAPYARALALLPELRDALCDAVPGDPLAREVCRTLVTAEQVLMMERYLR